MKRLKKSSMQGVTLLEIMLVLAIAAMVIVMSIRYYQSATSSQQVNSFLQQVQGITAADENLAQGGSYTSVTDAQIKSVLGDNALNVPWGGTATFASTTNGFSLTVPAPGAAVCSMITNRLSTNTNYTVASGCGNVTYDASK